jgi:hypothetical protein
MKQLLSLPGMIAAFEIATKTATHLQVSVSNRSKTILKLEKSFTTEPVMLR